MIKPLGVYIHNDLSFSANEAKSVFKCDSRIFLVRKIKILTDSQPESTETGSQTMQLIAYPKPLAVAPITIDLIIIWRSIVCIEIIFQLDYSQYIQMLSACTEYVFILKQHGDIPR